MVMETPQSLLKYGAGTSGLRIASAWELPTNCLTEGLNQGCDENGGGKCSSLPKFPFPTFDGEHPEIWKAKCLTYFHSYDISKCLWIFAAAMHMEGKAKDWWLMYKMQHELGSWNQFMDAVLEKFAAKEGSSTQAEKIMLQHPADLQQVLDGHNLLTQADFNAHVLSKTKVKAADVVWDDELEQYHGSQVGLLQLLAGGGEFPDLEKPEQVMDELLSNYDNWTSDLALGLDAKYDVFDELQQGGEDLSDKKKQLTIELNQVSSTSLLVEPHIDTTILDVLTHVDVVWDEDPDEEFIHVIDSHDGVLQQLAHGVTVQLQCKQDVVGPDAPYMFVRGSQVKTNIIAQAEQIRPRPQVNVVDVVWDEEVPSDMDVHTNLLRQLVQGRELVCDERLPSLEKHVDLFPMGDDTVLHVYVDTAANVSSHALQQLAWCQDFGELGEAAQVNTSPIIMRMDVDRMNTAITGISGENKQTELYWMQSKIVEESFVRVLTQALIMTIGRHLFDQENGTSAWEEMTMVQGLEDISPGNFGAVDGVLLCETPLWQQGGFNPWSKPTRFQELTKLADNEGVILFGLSSSGQDGLSKRHLDMDAERKISNHASKLTFLDGAYRICMGYRETTIFVRKLWDPGIWRYIIRELILECSMWMIILLLRRWTPSHEPDKLFIKRLCIFTGWPLMAFLRDGCVLQNLHWMTQVVYCLYTVLAWGQASFSGGGNVMTRMWPMRDTMSQPA